MQVMLSVERDGSKDGTNSTHRPARDVSSDPSSDPGTRRQAAPKGKDTARYVGSSELLSSGCSRGSRRRSGLGALHHLGRAGDGRPSGAGEHAHVVSS